MKNLFFKLVKKELFLLLITPGVYIMAIIFIVATSASFFFGEQFFVRGLGSADLRNFYLFIPYISIIIIPVLTMQVWRDEVFDIALSLPVSTLKLVLSKVVAPLVVMTLLQIILLLVPFGVNRFGTVDAGQIFCSNVIIFLYFCTTCAFGSFLSLATKNHITALIVTTFCLAIINCIHLLPLYLTVPNFALQIANALSFAWHFDSASKGIFATSDIVFFVVTTALFVFCSCFLLEYKKGKR